MPLKVICNFMYTWIKLRDPLCTSDFDILNNRLRVMAFRVRVGSILTRRNGVMELHGGINYQKAFILSETNNIFNSTKHYN